MHILAYFIVVTPLLLASIVLSSTMLDDPAAPLLQSQDYALQRTAGRSAEPPERNSERKNIGAAEAVRTTNAGGK